MKTGSARWTIALAAAALTVMAGCAAPRMVAPENPNGYYAFASVRLGQAGSVVLHFSIGPDGKVKGPILHDQPVVIAPPGDPLDSNASLRLLDGAERYIRATTFDVHGMHKRQLTASFVFEVKPCGNVAHSPVHDYAVSLCRERPPIVPIDQY